MTTNIRIEADDVLYNALVQEQERRRLKSTRKISLSTLIIEFCTKCLSEIMHNEQNSGQNEQRKDTGNNEMNISGQENEHYLRDKMFKKQHDFKEKEQNLNIREQNILNREREINTRLYELMKEQEELLDRKEQLQEEDPDTEHLQWLVKQMDSELKQKSETINEYKKETALQKDQIIKILLRLEQKSEKNILMDYIVPFLPSVISIIGFFLTNRKINSIQELSPIQTEINNIMKKLSGAEKERFNALLTENIKKYEAAQKKG